MCIYVWDLLEWLRDCGLFQELISPDIKSKYFIV